MRPADVPLSSLTAPSGTIRISTSHVDVLMGFGATASPRGSLSVATIHKRTSGRDQIGEPP